MNGLLSGLKSMNETNPPSSLRVRELVIVDCDGRDRIILGCPWGSDDTALIQLLNREGLPKLELQVDPDAACIRVNSPTDRPGVSIAATTESNGLNISDAGGSPVVELGTAMAPKHESPADGTVTVRCVDHAGNVIAEQRLTPHYPDG